MSDSRCLFNTNTVRHSKEASTAASTMTLSPVEQQRGFSNLEPINEMGPGFGAGAEVEAGSNTFSGPTDEEFLPTKPSNPWLTRFLVDTHLTALNRG